MKIAVWHNLISGGGKRALIYHIQALIRKGHYVEVWCPDTCVNDSLHELEEEVKINISPIKDKLDKLRRSNPFRRLIYNCERNKILKENCKQIAEEIHSKAFDIVFVNSCSINYMSYLGLYLKEPSVLYLGEPYRWNYEATPELVWAAPNERLSWHFIKNHIKLISNRFQVSEEIHAAKSYTKILVNSLYSRESVMRSYGVDSEVCYLGIDDSFFEEVESKKQSYVVGLGLVYYLKGIDRAIKTISRIPSSKRPTLIWIGNGEFPEYTREITILAKKLDVKLQLKLNIKENELKKIISEAAAMIYMPRLEPFGFAPLEANALGTSVVGIAEGGLRETISHGNNGFLVFNEDYEQAASYIQELVTDIDHATLLGNKSKSYVKSRWSFDNLSSNIEAALYKVLDSPVRH